MGQELGVETLNKVGAILTQYGASWCAWPAEISIEVQGTKEALGSAAATPTVAVVVVVALWMLICCHCCREDRRIELILAGSLLIDLLHIDGTLIEHRLLHIAWHQRIVFQQQFPIGGLYKWKVGGGEGWYYHICVCLPGRDCIWRRLTCCLARGRVVLIAIDAFGIQMPQKCA